jgi:putative phosphoribosyl transferase
MMPSGPEPIRVVIPPAGLEGDLTIPDGPCGVVLFAHGSGSSRFSPRNRYVAGMLQQGRLATLLIDLLTPVEEEVDDGTRKLRFDIGMLVARLTAAADWLSSAPETAALEIGCFGASTGGAAALVTAAERPDLIRAVVSRGGRPDLAGPALPRVQAPTLLIVGGNDTPVIGMNRTAYDELQCDKRMDIVPGATHLFEEPGKLDDVARLARDWFVRRLGRR